MVQTTMGSCFTLLMLAGVLFYTILKMEVFLKKKDVDIMTSTRQNYLTPDDELSFSDGLNFAAAFTAYDNELDPILDKSIGELVFKSYQWGEDETGWLNFARERLSTHTCTREELGLEDP